MSDSREQAQAEIADVGIEDSLGAALSSSFNLPPAPAPPVVSAPEPAAAEPVVVEADAPAASSDAAEPDWKAEYEQNLAKWRAEGDVAREKAAATRKKFEDEAAAQVAAEKARLQAETREKDDKRKELEKQERLRQMLSAAGSGASSSSSRKPTKAEERERDNKVRDAWEMVKGDGEGAAHEVVTDGRGVLPQDIGVASAPDQERPKPSVAVIPDQALPPNLDTTPSSPDLHGPADGIDQSRYSATSAAWTEVSPPSSAEDLSPPGLHSSAEMSPPAPTRGLKPEDASYNKLPSTDAASPAAAKPTAGETPSNPPPSLTLSLFTAPGSLSVSRILAVLGINVILPFINGVALGFGEIFARETVRVGRLWWKGERALFGWRKEQQGGSRGVASVGLSGSGGFP